MILSLIYLGFKTIGITIFVIVAIMGFHYIRASKKLRRLEGEAIFSYPKNEVFFLGMAEYFTKYQAVCKENTEEA